MCAIGAVHTDIVRSIRCFPNPVPRGALNPSRCQSARNFGVISRGQIRARNRSVFGSSQSWRECVLFILLRRDVDLEQLLAGFVRGPAWAGRGAAGSRDAGRAWGLLRRRWKRRNSFYMSARCRKRWPRWLAARRRWRASEAGACGAGDGDCVGWRRAAAEVHGFLSEADEQ